MIKITDLCFSYKSREIKKNIFKNIFSLNEIEIVLFENINIEIFDDSKIIGLLGRNRAGKTTLIKLISGILTPNSGNITVFGIDSNGRPLNLLSNLGIVFGNKSMLWDELSLYENIELFSKIYKRNYDKNSVENMIEMLNLNSIAKKPAKTCSLGQSVKSNLLIHFLNRPKLLILDEPTIGLDIESQILLRNILKDYAQNNESKILITSHNMIDIADVCKDIIFLKDGEISKIHLNKNNSKEKNALYLERLFCDN
ncbi:MULTISPECIES: ATP-binding cassette domain-containing protein [Photorhabdus]|uniref:ATP-binding cassette domain-containing protein n=1 Tax=Photorhabdus TaxID=29487 RepID=UPI000DCD25FF|nr:MULTISPECIES: ATP-binding cassette domain-containing protein [Photorhabdus]AXG42065.1 ABC transporter ATP-binding protein [Photorhabdus laumondii subsp. laumondii]NDL16826.1 ATP-binding cassette domain-containing protein [Photorhabdus laumondii subsp. laumondii]NDL48555.1 ATP-binding cassette domain-containing protein [Photorhabdus laumondii subsp. laumondii]NDL53102.1 ATP-binding cassette domain-containing protein [Photorhabdus laumondii subsp. laumondii]RAW84556.1 ABC transporter ATP-bind